MNETTRRRMLWVAIVAASGFFLLTMLLAVMGGLNEGWYIVGGVVYGVVFLLALVGFVTEAAPVASEPARAPEFVPLSRYESERVVYATPRGQVIEIVRDDGKRLTRDYLVESEAGTLRVKEVEREVDRRKLEAGEYPEDETLIAGLSRWGRIREAI